MTTQTVVEPEPTTAELSLPDKLNGTDRCTLCGAQAFHAYIMLNGGTLYACNHHSRETLAHQPHQAHRDYRMDRIEAERQAQTQLNKAKADQTGKTSPEPPTPAHATKWDTH